MCLAIGDVLVKVFPALVCFLGFLVVGFSFFVPIIKVHAFKARFSDFLTGECVAQAGHIIWYKSFFSDVKSVAVFWLQKRQ